MAYNLWWKTTFKNMFWGYLHFRKPTKTPCQSHAQSPACRGITHLSHLKADWSCCFNHGVFSRSTDFVLGVFTDRFGLRTFILSFQIFFNPEGSLWLILVPPKLKSISYGVMVNCGWNHTAYHYIIFNSMKNTMMPRHFVWPSCFSQYSRIALIRPLR